MPLRDVPFGIYYKWNMKNKNTLADQLREAIRRSGKTAYAIAKLADTTPPVVSRFMEGERDLRLETAGRIAAALGFKLAPDPGKVGSQRKER
jgi:plasmid maintenance system antidote protein VapI